MYAFAKTLALTLLLPPTAPLLVIFIGLAISSHRQRAGRIVATLGAISLWLASTPLLVLLLTQRLGVDHAISLDEAKRAQAIVVLGAGVRTHAVEFGGETLGRLTLERVHYAATLARQTGLPILVSGGVPPKTQYSEAELMRSSLEAGGTHVKWVENRSENTHENAVKSAAVLRANGIESVLLVTHAFDAPRALRRFKEAGVDVIPAPTQIPVIQDLELQALMPSASALSDSYYLGYELLAQLADRLIPGR